jgi:hypothetical protein
LGNLSWVVFHVGSIAETSEEISYVGFSKCVIGSLVSLVQWCNTDHEDIHNSNDRFNPNVKIVKSFGSELLCQFGSMTMASYSTQSVWAAVILHFKQKNTAYNKFGMPDHNGTYIMNRKTFSK